MDDHRTEAACLLETGALYRSRIGLELAAGDGGLVFAGFKHGAFSLYFDDAPIYHFDLEGRWQRAFIDGLHYLRGLDGTVHEIDRVREGPNLMLHRRKLGLGEASDLDARIRSTALDVAARLVEDRFRRRHPPDGKARPLDVAELRDFLETIGRWDAAAWFSDRERYNRTYGPLPFLPPECRNAVVVQATRGHADGRTFGLSAPAEPHVRSEEEFVRHVRDVAALWGRRLLQSRAIFLAGDDVLQQPASRVEAYLDVIGRTFPIGPDRTDGDIRFDGVHAFLDDFAGSGYGIEDWRRLVALGLIRVSLGVESGDPEVRGVYGKDWTDPELRSTVENLKAAGLGASVLTLLGAGGVDRAEAHVERTAGLIESLDLGRGDFVFLLDEDEVRDPGAEADGLATLDEATRARQRRRLLEAMATLRARGVKVLPYRIQGP